MPLLLCVYKENDGAEAVRTSESDGVVAGRGLGVGRVGTRRWRGGRSVGVLADGAGQRRSGCAVRGAFAVVHRGDPGPVLLVEGGCHPCLWRGPTCSGAAELVMLVWLPLA